MHWNLDVSMPLIRIIFVLGLLIFSATPELCSAGRALLIGIGDYDTDQTGWRKIHGDDDVTLLAPLLKENGYTVSSLTNNYATKKNIVAAIKKLANECRAGDHVYLRFSCHGQPVTDCNGDESREYDEAIAPYDALKSEGYASGNGKYRGENHLIDDEIAPLLDNISRKIGKTGILFVAFDACYSRGLEKGDNDFPEDFDVDELPDFMRGTADFFSPTDKTYLQSLKPPQKFSMGSPIAIVSACRENERNFELRVGNRHYGSLSYCIYKQLLKNADLLKWVNYFKSGSYKTSGCFLKIQHPSITLYQ